MELIAQVVLVLLGSAIPAFAAAWFMQRGGEVLADAFRPMAGQAVAPDEAWPRGVQEEEPRPWGLTVAAEQLTEGDRLPHLQPVRRGHRASS